MKSLLRTIVLATGVFAAGSAQAATALVTTDLNVRSGPGTRYAAIGTLPNGARVDVRGCTAGYGWCHVYYGGLSGWASSRYLATRQGSAGYSGDFSNSAAAIGIPLIAGAIIGSALSDRHYYRDRGYYRDRWHRRHWHRDRWDGPRWRDRPSWRDRGDWDRPRWRSSRRIMPNWDGPR
ncbi:ligand-binding protein SH3 [Paramesorhizobium deserti]|uniref:Ligand-binding protein SH3 n=1 Tax=Paramesorhizobium deserti TaxID=1494590 RepID=A0A135HU93_9HYPH|nr:SH3 domain-containing protein [Paramesorhizobium deserti]KXF76749.1 ligand-binding protein SH3 [Paramesorhizobium deserti]